MTTAAEIKKHLAAADAFIAVQRQHLASLADGKCGDLSNWRCNRQVVFVKLQDALAKLQLSDIAEAEQQKILMKFKEIVGLEAKLKRAVQGKKIKLTQALAAMRKGRKALHGYGGKSSLGPQPRFLSSRM